MHDKCGAILNAASAIGQNSILCDFHSLSAAKKRLAEDSTTLLMGFKVLMRYTGSCQFEKGFISIIYSLPTLFVSDATKESVVSYFLKNWFDSEWRKTLTRERHMDTHYKNTP